ncbi:MAG: hypothetical protein U5N85_19210 [Arcicella sp.]|nr:hypothetical protein [Arcicella sp.]
MVHFYLQIPLSNRVKKNTVFALFVLGLFSSCRDELDCGCVSPPVSGKDFFYPIKNQVVIYDIEETQYSLTSIPVVKNYQLKEIFVSSSTESNGNETLRIERYRRENDSQKWVIDSVFTAKKGIDKALKTENNVTFVKLIFPVSEGLKWNGNAYNSLGEDTYELKKVFQPFQTNRQNFNRTLTVIQQNDSTLVDLKRRIEVYAEGIGRIYQEKTNVSYCNSGDCLGKGKIDFGTKYIVKIKSYEK